MVGIGLNIIVCSGNVVAADCAYTVLGKTY